MPSACATSGGKDAVESVTTTVLPAMRGRLADHDAEGRLTRRADPGLRPTRAPSSDDEPDGRFTRRAEPHPSRRSRPPTRAPSSDDEPEGRFARRAEPHPSRRSRPPTRAPSSDDEPDGRSTRRAEPPLAPEYPTDPRSELRRRC